MEDGRWEMGDGAVEFLVVDARLQGVLEHAGPGPKHSGNISIKNLIIKR